MQSRKASSATVRTRRFGNAVILPVDGASHLKRCSWNCIYCPTHQKLQTSPTEAAESWLTQEQILKQVQQALDQDKQPDSVVLGAITQDPTYHPDFVLITRSLLDIQKQHSKLNFVCITNGEMLQNTDVKAACESYNQLWVKLDAALPHLHQNLSGTAAFIEHIHRIKSLKQVWLQSTFWRHQKNPKLQNWTPDNLEAMLTLYSEIRPQLIHLTTIQRSCLLEDLQPISSENLDTLAQQISEQGLSCSVFP